MKRGLTIGQAAAFAGVTIKTVRHYHRLGLVPEPKRDNSDYRRYDSADLLRLVQVRTLAEAGVPLAEISGLLEANPDEFAAAMTNVQSELDSRIAELIRRRETLQRLAHGNRVMLPDRACGILDRFTELGFSADYVALQEEALVLYRALLPQQFSEFLGQLESRLGDPVYVDLAKRSWKAASWRVDDPRLNELASDLAENLLSHHLQASLTTGWPAEAKEDVSTRYDLVNDHRGDQLPTLARLTALIEVHLRAAGLEIPDEQKNSK